MSGNQRRILIGFTLVASAIVPAAQGVAGIALPIGESVAWVLGTACLSKQETPQTQPPATGPSTASKLALPNAVMAPREGIVGDAAYARSIANRAEALRQQADEQTEPAVRIHLLLAAANLILAYELEPACTRRFYTLPADAEAAPPSDAGDALARVDALLERAGAELSAVTEDARADWGSAAEHRHGVLLAFARGLREYLLPGEGAEASRVARQAASGLAVLLEDAHEQVMAAAALWHGALRGREPDPTAALSALPPALSDPKRASMPFAFFARLLRCRLVAGHGGHAVALGLLIQMEERCDEWFANEEARADALRTTNFVQMQILRDWHEKLGGPEDSPQRQWCADRIAKLSAERFGKGAGTLLPLSPVVPIVAVPGEANAAHPKPSGDGR